MRYLIYQDTPYRSESCKRKLRRNFTLRSSKDGHSSSSNIPSTLLLFLQAHLAAVRCSFSALSVSESLQGCQKTRAEDEPMLCMQLFCMLRCKSQIAPKKTQCLSCFTRNFRNMLAQHKLSVIVSPRYLEDRTCSDIC